MKEKVGAPFRLREQASFCTRLLALTKRSFVNMHRDIGYYWMRFAVFTACTCVGTVYHQIDNIYNSIQTRCNVMMYMTIFLTTMAIGGFPSFVQDIKLFRRERLSGHYGVNEFVISNTVSATPYLAVMIIIPGTVLYYLTGLTRGAGNVAYFVTTLYTCNILVESMMMVIAVVVPDFLMGVIVVGTGVQGMMMLNGGFFHLPSSLPKPVWKYPCYYISLHKYAVQGLYKNEFAGQTFASDQLVMANATITGHQVLEALQVEMWYSKWVNVAILFGMAVVYRMMFFAIVKVAEKLRAKAWGVKCGI
uniref:ABC-2 type transporter transmembrane domain-containing protein n=1 Tax=Oryza brachyantha TaxID=4533 RepID=J3NCY0_ORYBR